MFIENEQAVCVNRMNRHPEKYEEDILQRAIEALKTALPMQLHVKAEKTDQRDRQADRLLEIRIGDVQLNYNAEIKPALTGAGRILLTLVKDNLPHPLLLITQHVNQRLADRLVKDGIQFVDTVGNMFLNKPPLFVFIRGNPYKGKTALPQRGRAFRPAGLKLLYALLCTPGLEERTVREIAGTANVALGTVDWVIKELMNLNFLVDLGGRRYKLVQKDKLLQRWVAAYPEQLRPKQILGRFRGAHGWWNDARLDPLQAIWGGEVAAWQMTHYLQPQVATIYTTTDYLDQMLLENKLRKDMDGNTEVLQVFWNRAVFQDRGDVVHPILVYADLLATGDQRNIETARKIYDDHVVRFIRED